MQWPFEEWGASVVLAGHDHVYERVIIDNFPYFVNGLGGRSKYSFDTPIPGSEVRYNDDYGAMLIEANEDSINFKFIAVTEEVIDTYTLYSIIPVELISFSGKAIGSNIHLNWITATELNNYGFTVEKRQTSDVKRDKIWDEIGFVPGYGTTTEKQVYSFIDESAPSGKYQFRLKQIDYDGTFEYSNIVEVVVGIPSEFSVEQNYPNPFNPTTKINFVIPKSSFVNLKVYDVHGNKIATLISEQKTAGEYEIEFDGSELTSGVYFYQLKTGSYIETKKMVLLR